MKFSRLALCVLVLSVLSPGVVYADCGTPMGEILWLYPEKNATDVPTNMHIVVAVPPGMTLSVSLGDTVLEPSGAHGAHPWIYNPGDLMPNTTYELLVQVGDGPTVKKVAASFTTGEFTDAAVMDAPVIADVFSAEDQGEHCAYLAASYWCAAADEPMVALDVSTDGIGWVVTTGSEATLWPADCRPQIPQGNGACYEVTALFANGLQSTETSHCEPGGKSDGGGCAVSPKNTSSGPFALLIAHVLGLLFLIRRRARA